MKRQHIQQRINFSMPLNISKGVDIVNADADVIGKNIEDFDASKMYVEGLAATDHLDLDQQILKPSGFETAYFNKSGFINWNHQNYSPDSIIGEPTETKVTDENFFLKAKLYPWSNMAKTVYQMGLNLQNDTTSDRTLGFSIEGLTLETENDLVSKMLVTGCAICVTPKNNDTYCRIVKGITLDEVKELRKNYLFTPIYSEEINGNKEDIIFKLNFGEKQLLITKGLDFVFRENPIFSVNSIEDVQKAICTIAQGFKEGFIKKDRKEDLIKIIKEKAKQFKIK